MYEAFSDYPVLHLNTAKDEKLVDFQVHLDEDFVWSIESLIAVIRAETLSTFALQIKITMIWICPTIMPNEQAGRDDLYLLFEEDLGTEERAVMVVVDYQGPEGSHVTLCAHRVPPIVEDRLVLETIGMSDTCRDIGSTCTFSFWATPLPTRWATFNGMKINVEISRDMADECYEDDSTPPTSPAEEIQVDSISGGAQDENADPGDELRMMQTLQNEPFGTTRAISGLIHQGHRLFRTWDLTRQRPWECIRDSTHWIPDEGIPIVRQIDGRWNLFDIETETAVVRDSFPTMNFVQHHLLVKAVDERKVSFLADYTSEARVYLTACVIDTAFPTLQQLFDLIAPGHSCGGDTRCTVKQCGRKYFWNQRMMLIDSCRIFLEETQSTPGDPSSTQCTDNDEGHATSHDDSSSMQDIVMQEPESVTFSERTQDSDDDTSGSASDSSVTPNTSVRDPCHHGEEGDEVIVMQRSAITSEQGLPMTPELWSHIRTLEAEARLQPKYGSVSFGQICQKLSAPMEART